MKPNNYIDFDHQREIIVLDSKSLQWIVDQWIQ
jgi:hypothetical protein